MFEGYSIVLGDMTIAIIYLRALVKGTLAEAMLEKLTFAVLGGGAHL